MFERRQSLSALKQISKLILIIGCISGLNSCFNLILAENCSQCLGAHKYIYNLIWNITEILRFKLLLKVNPVLEHVPNSNTLTYLAPKPVFHFMSVYHNIDELILRNYRKQKKKISYIFNCFSSQRTFFKLLQLKKKKHFHFLNFINFW